MNETISVRSISRLSKTSVQSARNSICVVFSDERHIVVVPIMGYGKVVKSIGEIRLNHNSQVLARIVFHNGARIVIPGSDSAILDMIPEYVRSVTADIDNWVVNEDFEHVRKVIEALSRFYPEAS
ncbi:MAG: hypothetical protein NVSMB39_3490 [Candidatus Saccharimonadales bacterium]